MKRIAIIGAAGYSGGELVECLLAHPRCAVAGLFASAKRAEGEKPQTIGELFPRLRARIDLPVEAADPARIAQLKPDAVFLCTPHAASHDLAPELLSAIPGVVVLDLSAAFRLKDASLYPRKYAFEHRHPRLLERAVYGIPELFRAQLRTADLVAVAGCYPTSAILPLRPLVAAGALAAAGRVIIDSTSGVSGAGRSPQVKTLFCEVSLQPYEVFHHRHNPEIDAYAGRPTLFTPHLGPYDRGILSTIHAELAPGWTAARCRDELARCYAAEPFVRLLPPGAWPSVAGVERTNFCDIGLAADDASGHLIVVSAIDNLVKGAAGQAVQCLNARFGWPETMGLPAAPPAEAAR
ncbi:MAG: N-acetyl-gamma-glutamyl-phosphate reductase [Phycisphaerales bacterium]|nr:N-acetyl-gamma-glutamyl-phosphate reductase [Phycisphaerales bacterium]